ncbi:hypothetical protein LCGC14_2475540 [marine sediment metagenome]|uniref:Fibronectin type-III domain-containing protein n=1 Tax=marine sediment metagenome TaxID=412755 RepID=A0A0F9DL75_9ZZZZ
MAVTVNLTYPTNGLAGFPVSANFSFNITSGSIQKVQLWLNGGLVEEKNVINWSGPKFFNPTDDLSVDTDYTWMLKVQDWSSPFAWFDSDETWSFDTNVLPEKPINPTPTDAAADVTLDQATITWEDGGRATSYDVYYGDTSGSLTLVSSGQAGLSFTVDGITLGSPFDYLITRYWRIDAVNASGTTTGDEWSFVSIAFDQIRVSYRLISGGNGQGPYDSPPGVQGTDWEYTGESNMITIKKLIAAANNTIWIEDI